MNTILRRTFVGLAGFGLLVAIFYAEEDLRGWHAWHQFEQTWKARGENFDFASVVPPKVPDDQNFAMSPVWAAEIKYVWQNNPERVAAWYGRRVDDDEASKIFSLLPVGVSGLAGTNWAARKMPKTPEVVSRWTTGQATDLTPWQSYYRDLQKTTPAAGIPITAWPQSPAADVLLALSKYDPVFARLRQDEALPESRFPVIYTIDDPAEILLPHLAILKRYAQVLHLRAVAELQNGQSEPALADVKLMLRLTASARSEPFIISHLVRIAIVNLALQPVWEGLTAHQWSAAQLTELDGELAKLDFLADYKFSLRGEVGCQGGIFDYLRRNPDQFANLTGNGNPAKTPFMQRALWRLVPGGWFYENRAGCARPVVELYLPIADTNSGTISPTAVRKVEAAVKAETSHPNRDNLAERAFVPSLGGVARRFAFAQGSLDLAQVAIALERYHILNGEYPETLDTLTPRFIERLPPDIINGQPLQYRRSPDGKFLVYSVGWNEKDDDGQVTAAKDGTIDNTRGDWVWKSREPQ